jgi:2,3-diketo-5-methylthio-1-phosphopentane phosphatase
MELSNIKHYLFAFDMDFTILEENTDYEIRDLISEEQQEEVLNQKLDSWGDLVNSFFCKFKDNGISIKKIEERIKRIPLTPGMDGVFDFIRILKKDPKNRVDCIIVSGANVTYCKWVVESHKLEDVIDKFYSFNCIEKEGKLEIGPTHEHQCKLCDILMCKKKAIEEFISSIRIDNKCFKYENIFYFGDGGNDICPGLNLNSYPLIDKSYLLVRRDYVLHKKLFDENDIPNSLCKSIPSEVLLWKNGHDLLNTLKNIFKK